MLMISANLNSFQNFSINMAYISPNSNNSSFGFGQSFLITMENNFHMTDFFFLFKGWSFASLLFHAEGLGLIYLFWKEIFVRNILLFQFAHFDLDCTLKSTVSNPTTVRLPHNSWKDIVSPSVDMVQKVSWQNDKILLTSAVILVVTQIICAAIIWNELVFSWNGILGNLYVVFILLLQKNVITSQSLMLSSSKYPREIGKYYIQQIEKLRCKKSKNLRNV